MQELSQARQSAVTGLGRERDQSPACRRQAWSLTSPSSQAGSRRVPRGGAPVVGCGDGTTPHCCYWRWSGAAESLDLAGILSDSFFSLRAILGKYSFCCCSLADQHRGLQSFPTCPDSILPSHSLTTPHNPLQSPLLTCSLNTCLFRLLCQNSLLLSLRPVPPIVCLKIRLDYLMIEFLPTSVSCLSKLWSENLLQI